MSWWNIQEGEDKDGPPLQSCQPGVVFKSTEHNFSSHFFNMSAASQVEAKNRIKMVIITFSRGKYRQRIWVDEKTLLQFWLFQYSLVIQIQGQTGTASKLKTNLVKTNNPYGALCTIVSSWDFHYVPTKYLRFPHRKDSRIFGEFENWIPSMNHEWPFKCKWNKFLMLLNSCCCWED